MRRGFTSSASQTRSADSCARSGSKRPRSLARSRDYTGVPGFLEKIGFLRKVRLQEIKALLGESVDRVQAGAKFVEEAGSTINEIVHSVKRVTDIMGEVSSASQEQSTGIEQVNQAVTQMDEVTQQNAALVEQASDKTVSRRLRVRELHCKFVTGSSLLG
jgi:hypothetical protein